MTDESLILDVLGDLDGEYSFGRRRLKILTSVSMFLEDAGHDVKCYHDWASVLEALSKNPVDIAVFDIKMPRIDGIKLLRCLRQTSHMPVIFLTSKDDEFEGDLWLNMGAGLYHQTISPTVVG